ncbi:MAG TPA: DNA/RNA non-specific endonuclease, partial [Pirellulales bacterium]
MEPAAIQQILLDGFTKWLKLTSEDVAALTKLFGAMYEVAVNQADADTAVGALVESVLTFFRVTPDSIFQRIEDGAGVAVSGPVAGLFDVLMKPPASGGGLTASLTYLGDLLGTEFQQKVIDEMNAVFGDVSGALWTLGDPLIGKLVNAVAATAAKAVPGAGQVYAAVEGALTLLETAPALCGEGKDFLKQFGTAFGVAARSPESAEQKVKSLVFDGLKSFAYGGVLFLASYAKLQNLPTTINTARDSANRKIDAVVNKAVSSLKGGLSKMVSAPRGGGALTPRVKGPMNQSLGHEIYAYVGKDGEVYLTGSPTCTIAEVNAVNETKLTVPGRMAGDVAALKTATGRTAGEKMKPVLQGLQTVLSGTADKKMCCEMKATGVAASSNTPCPAATTLEPGFPITDRVQQPWYTSGDVVRVMRTSAKLVQYNLSRTDLVDPEWWDAFLVNYAARGLWDKGHLIASIFGGSTNPDQNNAAQNRNFNRSAWKTCENRIAKIVERAVSCGGCVKMTITIEYSSSDPAIPS